MSTFSKYLLAAIAGFAIGAIVWFAAVNREHMPTETIYVVTWTGGWRHFYVEEEGRFFRMQQKVEGYTNVSLAKRVVTEENL